MENIINSFFIKQSRITELTFEFTERLWIQSVQYEVSTVEHIPYIVTTGGRNKLYKLEENPDVTKYGEDLYHIRSIMIKQREMFLRFLTYTLLLKMVQRKYSTMKRPKLICVS